MPNSQGFAAGDFVVFQVESGYGLLKVLGIEGDAPVWHVAVFGDLFPEIEYAELAIASPESLAVDIEHVAMTDRAFESTQVSRLGNSAITDSESAALDKWRSDPNREISDRSIRLLLGLR